MEDVTVALPEALQRDLECWLDAGFARHLPPLTERELRQGIRALSSLYVERRAAGPIAPRAIDGAAKRAGFALYYATLHFLTVCVALDRVGTAWLGEARRVIDLGAGTGACGAALARCHGRRLQLIALDRSGWALAEARRTHSAFGLRGRSLRASLPGGLPAARRGDVLVLGWAVNELAGDERETLRRDLESAVRRGARLLVLEPLASRVAPWWDEWSAAFERLGLCDSPVRARIELPERIESLDRATGLRHEELGARVLYGPVSDGPAAGRSDAAHEEATR